MKKNKLLYFNFLLISMIFITQFDMCDIFNFWKFISCSILITYAIKEIINIFAENNGYFIPKENEFNFSFATFSFSCLSYIALFILLPFSISNLFVFVSIADIRNLLIAISIFLFLSLIYALILYYILIDVDVEKD